MATKTKSRGVKEQIRQVLKQLPDDCSVENVQYQLYIIEKINRSEESLRHKGGISHDEVKRRVAAWVKR